MITYVLPILLTFSSISLAQEFKPLDRSECSDVRLDRKPGVMAEVPIQDQDGTLLCAAYVSSQMIDAWRAKNESPLRHVTSPIGLGVEFAAKTNKTSLTLLSAPQILETASGLSSCSYDVINDKFNNEDASKFLTDIHDYFALYARNPEKRNQVVEGIQKCMIRSGLSSKVQITAQQIEAKLSQDNSMKFNQALFETICKDHTIKLNNIPKPIVQRSNSYGNVVKGMNAFRDTINKQLKNAGQPVAINFCREVFNNPTVRTVSDDGTFTVNSKADPSVKKIFKTSPTGCSSEPHSSPIVGRRLLKYKDDKNQDAFVCQYLVRDSYGTSCNDYPADPTATPSDRCEKGQVWVDEDALLSNAAAVYHL